MEKIHLAKEDAERIRAINVQFMLAKKESELAFARAENTRLQTTLIEQSANVVIKDIAQKMGLAKYDLKFADDGLPYFEVEPIVPPLKAVVLDSASEESILSREDILPMGELYDQKKQAAKARKVAEGQAV